MPDYICWAPHHENLTAQVRAVLEEKGEPVLMMATAGRNEDGEEDAHTVVVSCSEDHRNVFVVHVP